MEVLKPYFQSYCKAAYETKGWILPNLKMKSSWVNYMKAGEFNPPHTHKADNESCLLSCVLYLNIPEDMSEEKHISNSAPPGSIEFMYGQPQDYNTSSMSFAPKVGDFYIFPGWLIHCVYPFKSNGTRISISANLVKLIQ